MKLLDTNIVMYAVGRPHPHKEACQQLFQDIAAGSIDYVIDVELLQEVLYVYSSRGQLQHALGVVDLLLRVFPEPLPIGKEEIAIARDILERHPRLSPRDAIHLGVTLNHRLDGIVTTDQRILQSEVVTCFTPDQLYPK